MTADPLTVLVVEDDPDLRRILYLQLAGDGFRVRTAADGEEGFRLLQAELPDCVVLDLMMPVLDGFAFLKRLRSLRRTAEVPAIVLTASEDQRHRRRSEQYLADLFLQKPHDMDELCAAIRRLAARRTAI